MLLKIKWSGTLTEFSTIVEFQRTRLAAEKWADTVETVHVHSLKSMWYENEKSLKDFEGGAVTDPSYCDGHIERYQNGKHIRTFGRKLKGEELLEAYISKAT